MFRKLYSDYRSSFPQLISKPRFNIRRRGLQYHINEVCLSIAEQIKDDEFMIIGSIPLPICANPRISRSKSCKDDPQIQPDRGYHASHKAYYYCFKMQLLIKSKGSPISGTLFPASCHDAKALHYIREAKRTNCELIADKGYLSTQHQLSLFDTLAIKLITPLRANMTTRKGLWSNSYRYKRKQVETLFTTLRSDESEKNYAKTLDGLITRVVSKLASVAVLQYLNIKNNRSINHLKYALAFNRTTGKY